MGLNVSSSNVQSDIDKLTVGEFTHYIQLRQMKWAKNDEILAIITYSIK